MCCKGGIVQRRVQIYGVEVCTSANDTACVLPTAEEVRLSDPDAAATPAEREQAEFEASSAPKHYHYANYIAIFASSPPFAVEAVLPLTTVDACIARDGGAEHVVYMSSLELGASTSYWPNGAANLTGAVALIGVGMDNARSWVYKVRMAELLRGLL